MAEEVDIGMPTNLEVASTYRLRFTALDANGAVVAGVKVSTTVLTADDGSTVAGALQPLSGDLGEWFYVTGAEF